MRAHWLTFEGPAAAYTIGAQDELKAVQDAFMALHACAADAQIVSLRAIKN